MRSSDRRYLAPVDHLRALAAVLIVLYHGCQLLSAHLAHHDFRPARDWRYSRDPAATLVFEGHTAVALFMVLSGFIFTVGSLGKQVAYRRFLVNRLLRIYPLYLLITVMGVATQQTSDPFRTLLRCLTLSPPFGTYSGVSWTIFVEVQFYLIFPLLNRLLGERGPAALLRLLAAVAVLRALVWLSSATPVNGTWLIYFSLAGRLDQFLLGMLAAWYYRHHRARFQARWQPCAAFALVIGTLWVFNQLHGFLSNSMVKLLWTDVEGGVWALLVITYVAGCTATGRISHGLARIGEVSYSMYLTHFMVINVLCTGGWPRMGLSPLAASLIITVVIALPVTLALSFLTYRAVELPFLRLRTPYLSHTTTGDPPGDALTGESRAGAQVPSPTPPIEERHREGP